MMPAMNIETMTIIDPIDSNEIPEIPFPLVHPSAMRAPRSMINPPQKATIDRWVSVVVPVVFCQIGENDFLRIPDNVEESHAPPTIPKTNPSCHQCLSTGKQLLDICCASRCLNQEIREHAMPLKETELPIEA